MLLGKPLTVFIEQSPVSVMVSATIERVFEPAVLDKISRTTLSWGTPRSWLSPNAFKSCAASCSRNRHP